MVNGYNRQYRIFAVKNILVDSIMARKITCGVSDEVDDIDLLDLASELVNKVVVIVGKGE